MLDFTFSTAPELSAEFAKRVKAQRMRLDLAQPELAQRAGLALGTVSAFEKTGRATLDTLFRLVIALGLVKELEGLFLQQPTSIKDLEALSRPARKRVMRRPVGSR